MKEQRCKDCKFWAHSMAQFNTCSFLTEDLFRASLIVLETPPGEDGPNVERVSTRFDFGCVSFTQR